MNSLCLNHVNVLVTRPAAQAQQLMQKIIECRGKPILFPTLEIADIEDKTLLNQQIDQLAQFDIAIFVSVNAVQKAAALLTSAKLNWPKKLKTVAVGATTAEAIKKLKWPLAVVPNDEFNSEAVLALPELQTVNAKKIIIFCGEGGRPLLADTLKQRGAEIELAIVYRRIKPRAILKQNVNIDLIVCTSNQGLENLVAMVKPEDLPWLQQQQLVGPSQRMVALAKELHFVKPLLVAANATDDAIMQTLINWAGENRHGSNSSNQRTK